MEKGKKNNQSGTNIYFTTVPKEIRTQQLENIKLTLTTELVHQVGKKILLISNINKKYIFNRIIKSKQNRLIKINVFDLNLDKTQKYMLRRWYIE